MASKCGGQQRPEPVTRSDFRRKNEWRVGARGSVTARVGSNGQPRMFVINQFVERPRTRPGALGGELGQETGLVRRLSLSSFNLDFGKTLLKYLCFSILL